MSSKKVIFFAWKVEKCIVWQHSCIVPQFFFQKKKKLKKKSNKITITTGFSKYVCARDARS